MDEVLGIHRQLRVAACQLNTMLSARENQPVAKIDRLHHRFQFMEAVRPPAQNVEQQVDLAG